MASEIYGATARRDFELIFDAGHAAAEARAVGAAPRRADETALAHWLRVGEAARIVPTPFFDEACYQRSNPDVAASGAFGFVHFLNHGLAEGRRPVPWFDQSWYGQAAPGRPPGRHPFIHFLTQGASSGTSPVASLRQLDWPTDAAAMHKACQALDVALSRLAHTLPAALTDRLLSLFEPEHYRAEAHLAADLPHIALLCHFLGKGWHTIPNASPLFDAGLYDAACQDRNRDARDEPALLHWLRSGIAAGIVPVTWFDATFYAASVPGLTGRDIDRFLHFIDHGRFERRRPNAWLDLPAARQSLPAIPPFDRHRRDPGPQDLAPRQLVQALTLLAPDSRPIHEAGGNLDTALRDTAAELGAAAAALLLQMFVPEFHADQAGLPRATRPLQALWHYLTQGLRTGASPSPLFDAAVYARRWAERTGTRLPEAQPAITHYLRHGLALRIVPTLRFSESCYLSAHPDLAAAGLFGYDHFIRHGVHENRRPVAWFDPESCRHRQPGPADMPPYLRALLVGFDAGIDTSPMLTRLLGEGQMSLARFDALLAATDAFADADLDLLLSLFVPESYDGQGALPARATMFDRLIHFCRHGVAGDESPGPLFMAQLYRHRLAEAGLAPPDGPALLHFLEIGAAARIVPTSVFDLAYYRRSYPDIAGAPIWPFLHFIRHGLYEGRRCSPLPLLELAPPPGMTARAAARWRLLLAAGGSPVHDTTGAARRLVHTQDRLRRMIASDTLATIMAEAQAQDPAVGTLSDIDRFYAAPFHDPIEPLHRAMLSRLARRHYDTLVCVPGSGHGAADRASAALAPALRRVRRGESVLLLRTDAPSGERPGPIAPGIDALDLADLLVAGGEAMAERLLNTLFLGLAPLRIINLDSLRCWRTYQRFGARLATRIDLYASLFGQHRPTGGQDLGAAGAFYPVCAPFLTGVFTADEHLKADLTRIYALPPDLARALTPLPAPTRPTPHSLTTPAYDSRLAEVLNAADVTLREQAA